MKLKRLLSVLDVCECTADPELDIRDISFDSRTTQPGDLFAAVCGYESDGHRFIGAAAERGAAVVDAITEAGGTAWFHKLDITQPETVDALFADTKEHWGSIDVLVNNAAGMALKDGRVDEISLEDWDAVFASDVRSTFYCTKTVLPFMQEQGAGSIINIGSMASCGGDLGSTAYACAKAGVDMLTQYTALQYGKQNIRCNCVRPGLIVTPQNEAKVPQALKDIFLDNIEVDRKSVV